MRTQRFGSNLAFSHRTSRKHGAATGGGDHGRDALSQQCCTLALCAENKCPETCYMAKSCLVRLWRADASFRPRWRDIVVGHVSMLTKAQRTPRALSAWWRAGLASAAPPPKRLPQAQTPPHAEHCGGIQWEICLSWRWAAQWLVVHSRATFETGARC